MKYLDWGINVQARVCGECLSVTKGLFLVRDRLFLIKMHLPMNYYAETR
jgi:hypothetical protein